MRGKRNKASDRAVALDVQANQIRCGDSVTIVEGPHKGKVATIKRMSRAQLFLYSQFRSEHSGIFVVRSRSCVLTGGTKGGRSGARGTPGESPFSTPSSQTSGRQAMRGDRDESLMGKTVRIQAGQWKGYLGTVSHTTATHVQVELHSRLKKVMVVKDRVHVIGDKFGATGENAEQNGGFGAAQAQAGYLGGATPMHGGATPMHGGATPMHGGATPMHDGYGWVSSLSCLVEFLCLYSLTHVLLPSIFTVDQPPHTLQACQMTSGDLVALLIAMVRAVMSRQRLEAAGVQLVATILPPQRAILLETQVEILVVSIGCCVFYLRSGAVIDCLD